MQTDLGDGTKEIAQNEIFPELLDLQKHIAHKIFA